MQEYAGRAAIGHVRYATCGANDRSYAQPFERQHGCKWKWFAFAFNGQLANFQRAARRAAGQGRLPPDARHRHRSHHALPQPRAARATSRPDLVEVFRRLAEQFDGAYNIVFLNAMGDMVVARDPLGFRPLCYRRGRPAVRRRQRERRRWPTSASTDIRSLEPGELIVIQDDGVRIERFAPTRRPAHCFFEWIYFANVASTLDDRSVYLSRAGAGQGAGRRSCEDGAARRRHDRRAGARHGKAAADAMAFELGLPSVEGLMRNRYVGRTFIEGTEPAREPRPG